MHRRAVPLALALLLLVPLVPARAAQPHPVQPSHPVVTEPGPKPKPKPHPSPADAPDPSPSAAPAEPGTDPVAGDPGVAPGPAGPPRGGALDATDRWIVILRGSSDVQAETTRAARSMGVKVDRSFTKAFRGYSARLTGGQVETLRRDPQVAYLVPDAIVSVAAQSTPTGVRRIGGLQNPIAAIDGVDTRVDADVAVVDTGIDRFHPDLNVVGGVNCSTSDRSAWRDDNGHGTHVAGTVAALDNGIGVVGVAPGARLWAVRILNADGNGLLSWYVCGLDWIAAQRDPSDPSRPLFEAVNMSVAKSGADDRSCGTENNDILHQAICRLVASGVTVVAAAGNNSSTASALIPASYDEVITVSALADTDGRPGGLGGNLCYSWGTYDRDDTLADFSNGGWDVDLIAPGKCIWSTVPGGGYAYSSGTSMAAPHVTGAAALYKASRPFATPAEVKSALQTLGTLDWDTSTDRDAYHEKLLDVSALGPLADFGIAATAPASPIEETGGNVRIPVTVVRAPEFIEEVTLGAEAPAGFGTSFATTRLSDTSGDSTVLTVSVPRSTVPGRYDIVVTGTNWDRVRTTTVTLVVEGDAPTAKTPIITGVTGTTFATTSFMARAAWGTASDPTSPIAGYEIEWSVDGGAWGGRAALPYSALSATRTFVVGHAYAARIRARDAANNWSPWAESRVYRAYVNQDTSGAISRSTGWARYRHPGMSAGTTLYSSRRGAWVQARFTGRGFAVVMPKGPTRGQARLYIDGKYVATMNMYRSRPLPRQIVTARTWTASGAHTVRLVVVGTSGHARVDLDAIIVLR